LRSEHWFGSSTGSFWDDCCGHAGLPMRASAGWCGREKNKAIVRDN